MKRVTTSSLLTMKQNQEKISVLTAYDASFAKLFDEQGIDVLLIGDSLGMVLQGQDSTLSVSVADIAYHTQCVSRVTKRAFVIADMPFMSYATPEQTYANAAKLLASGCHMVKLEGSGDWLVPAIAGLVQRGVPVCSHLGLTPQAVNVLGGFKVQGKQPQQAQKMLEDAVALERVGVQMLLLECVPAALAQQIAESVSIPVIGIGAGVDIDGQVLVMHDILGISANYMPKFSKNYLTATGDIRAAVKQYIDEVKQSQFPGSEHSFN